MAGLPPWGKTIDLYTLVTAAKAQRQLKFQNNLQLAQIVSNVLTGNAKAVKELIPKDD